MSKYPNADIVLANKDATHAISEFLQYLDREGYMLVEPNKDYDETNPDDVLYFHIPVTRETLLANFIGIDVKEYEQEKQAMLQEYKEAQQ